MRNVEIFEQVINIRILDVELIQKIGKKNLLLRGVGSAEFGGGRGVWILSIKFKIESIKLLNT